MNPIAFDRSRLAGLLLVLGGLLAGLPLHAQPVAASRSSTGTPAEAAAAQAVVQGLLQQHFKTDMVFNTASVNAKAARLTPDLQRRLLQQLARPVPADEVPDIDGDPFTNAQDLPTRFQLEPAQLSGTQAEVAVRFSGHGMHERVRYVLQRVDGQWRVDDLRYADGSTLRQLLH
ncbi:hypothetical protein [Aquabacterium sp.]|uniref:hypothetical protein n=1 Tax=Aquabacterium sp. TaxID=1872578 RepID=UPI003783EA39